MILSYKDKYASMSDLIGQTFTSVKNNGDEIIFTNEEREYRLMHQQDCCENVYIDDVVGDLNDLVGTPITMSESPSSDWPEPKSETYGEGEKAYTYVDESYTWTFFKLATVKGYVDIKFYGTSNGYYSESAELIRYK